MRLLIALVLSVVAFSVRADPPKGLVLGVPRNLGNDAASSDARALEGYLSAALKQPVTAKRFDTYDELADALAAGDLDLAWITPLSYVRASAKSPVIPIAKALRSGLHYRSVYFVKKESAVKKLSDLKGLRVAWVDPGSAAGYLFPRGLLLREGLKLEGFFGKEQMYSDHKSVCNAVLTGEADVGATFVNGDDSLEKLRVSGCFETIGADAADKLRPVAVSDRIPNEVVAGRAGFDEAVAAQLAGVLALLPDTEAGRRLLSSVFRADGFGLALEQDFEPVRLVSKSLAAGRWIAAVEREAPRQILLGGEPETAPVADKGKKAKVEKKPAPKKPKGK